MKDHGRWRRVAAPAAGRTDEGAGSRFHRPIAAITGGADVLSFAA
jgi:hypothetical protein